MSRLATLLGIAWATLAAAAPLHPPVMFLDAGGEPAVETGRPVSPMRTCGRCHDTGWIERHAYHADVGRAAWKPGAVPGGRPFDQSPGGRPFDQSPGMFGRFDPLWGRTLTPKGTQPFDMGLADWVRDAAPRHVGGGPARTGLGEQPLDGLDPASLDFLEGHAADPATGEPAPWDWKRSGVVEMNCFVCHTPAPDHAARVEAIQAGRFAWAATATLAGTGLVEAEPGGEGWRYRRERFDATGAPEPELLAIQAPTDRACAACHGVVAAGGAPVQLGPPPYPRGTETTGAVFSPQRLSASAMNLGDKATRAHAFDVHAGRGVRCADCHTAPNDPAVPQRPGAAVPSHLRSDPRKPSIHDFLLRPDHDLAKGHTAQGTVARERGGTVARCADCHDPKAAHPWLPRLETHLRSMACEACHVPRTAAPARAVTDWTMVDGAGAPRVEYRGSEGAPGDPASLVTGFQPPLMARKGPSGAPELVPVNPAVAWYWVDQGGRPVRPRDLRRAFLVDGRHHPDLVDALDADGNRYLEGAELVLDTPAKVEKARARLAAVGVAGASVRGEVQPYSIHHGVVPGRFAVRACVDCHAPAGRLGGPFLLAATGPAEGRLEMVGDSGLTPPATLGRDEAGRWVLDPGRLPAGAHVPGRDRGGLVDTLGWLAVLLSLAGAVLHGLGRWLLGAPAPHGPGRMVYVYRFYERLWHWLQAGCILVLLATGALIHVPEWAQIVGMTRVLVAHEAAAALFVVNALLGLFFHLSTGAIGQFIPEPRDFLSRAWAQARYYLVGIFRGEPHPLAKRADRKLNPLQQVTYLALLNVLLPLELGTGGLLWANRWWPGLASWFGGTGLIGSVHALGAWLMAAFLVVHVYLTTTGERPMALLEAMITGWEHLPTPAPGEEEEP